MGAIRRAGLHLTRRKPPSRVSRHQTGRIMIRFDGIILSDFKLACKSIQQRGGSSLCICACPCERLRFGL